jgi:hypothetical protein
MFDDIEFDPMSAAAGVVGGVISLYVMSNSEQGLIVKLAGFAISCVICYFVFQGIKNKG